jgi:hypothetical protein
MGANLAQPDRPETASPDNGPETRFTPSAHRYRRRLAGFVYLLGAGMALAFLSMFISPPFDKWVGVPGVFCVFLSLAVFFTLPALTCPVCQKRVDSGFGQYCPTCGSPKLNISRLWGTRCEACGKVLGSYKYRNYSIHYCTHCGTHVDSHGV